MRPTVTPAAALASIAKSQGLDINSREFAAHMDSQDKLVEFRDRFTVPTLGSLPCETIGNPDEDCIYLLGNSLGLKPKNADKYMKEQLDNWGKMAAFMHLTGRLPAAYCDQPVKESLARIVGAWNKAEVAMMNGLTVNLHLLMVAFYRPEGSRNKIMIEDHAFPSDRYAVRSLLRVKNVSEDRMLVLRPREGETIIRTEDVLKRIEEEQEELAMIMLPGVQYYTGQKFNMEIITREANKRGIPIGWDLAHAAGNVKLRLHEWGVDFAAWCSYKYLNSGAGGVSGIFLHQRHHASPPPHLQGWWSNKQETRFEMRDEVDPAIGAETFRLCNPPPWLAAPHLASLEIFDEAGMDRVIEKQLYLTGFLEQLLLQRFSESVDIITPPTTQDRGCQLSLCFKMDVEKVHLKLQNRGVVCDLRGRVMRVAPAPLYNTFTEVWRFVNHLDEVLKEQ